LAFTGFSSKHEALRNKSKEWLARNQNNMCLSETTCDSTIQKSKADINHHYHLIEIFSPWYSCKNCSLVLSNNHSLHCIDSKVYTNIIINKSWNNTAAVVAVIVW